MWLKLSISFPLYTLFHALLRKIKAACFCIHPLCPHMSVYWRLLSLTSSAVSPLKRLDGLSTVREEEVEVGGQKSCVGFGEYMILMQQS